MTIEHSAKKHIWDEQKVRQRIIGLLDKIKANETEFPPDHAGGGVPAEVGLMWMLEKVAAGNFYGTVNLTVKGTTMMKPRLTDVSIRMHDELKDFLL